MVLEMTLNIKVGIVMLQELFICNGEISYSTFDFYWLQEKNQE